MMQDAQGNVVEWEVTEQGIVLVANGQPVIGVEREDWDAFALMTARFNVQNQETEPETKDVEPLPEALGSFVVLNEELVNLYTELDEGTILVRTEPASWVALNGDGTALGDVDLLQVSWKTLEA